MNFAQEVLKKQFTFLSGLECTLTFGKQPFDKIPVNKHFLQIIFCEDVKHWIVASTVTSYPVVKVFNSVFSTVDASTSSMLKDLLGSAVDIQMGKMQKQIGATDCGLFTIATCVSLANGKDPGEFMQDRLRSHLLTKGMITFSKYLFIVVSFDQ